MNDRYCESSTLVHRNSTEMMEVKTRRRSARNSDMDLAHSLADASRETEMQTETETERRFSGSVHDGGLETSIEQNREQVQHRRGRVVVHQDQSPRTSISLTHTSQNTERAAGKHTLVLSSTKEADKQVGSEQGGVQETHQFSEEAQAAPEGGRLEQQGADPERQATSHEQSLPGSEPQQSSIFGLPRHQVIVDEDMNLARPRRGSALEPSSSLYVGGTPSRTCRSAAFVT